ncbi:MAG TPA: hypothetical protein DCP90_02410 [Clostridiales bacterium]|nr:MAG: hypothetical protein A2Y22_07010 [Clostridiales bacterium GWD2_32_59]HAN09447.1 hypothetical protein [Clostridiales bacterium]
MFGLFKRKNNNQDDEKVVVQQDVKEQKRLVMEDAKISLDEIESKLYKIKGKYLFSSLLLFLAYYYFIVDFYNKNMEKIISVKELFLLKYIDMIKDIMVNFDENTSLLVQKNELLSVLKIANEKLHSTISNIKEQAEMDLSVDLKTLQDLIKMDF